MPDVDALDRIASGKQTVHLELPSQDRTSAFIAASKFTVRPAVVYDFDEHGTPLEAPDPVRIILTRCEVVKLGSLGLDTAAGVLGRNNAKIHELHERWLQVHDPAWSTPPEELTRDERTARKFALPHAWAEWADCSVWRLEFELDPTEKPRWLSASIGLGYTNSPTEAADPASEGKPGLLDEIHDPSRGEAVPASYQRKLSSDAQAGNLENRDNRHKVRSLARACRKRSRTLERYGVRSAGGVTAREAAAAITENLAALDRKATATEKELRELAGEGRFPGHLLRAGWEDER